MRSGSLGNRFNSFNQFLYDMLYLIGLGLQNEFDITLNGLEAVKKCELVYLESYTSLLPGINIENLQKLYGKQVIVAHREMVESGSIVFEAKSKNVALLVVGDPFGATTHTDLVLRAKEEGIKFKVYHNASIMNAIGSTGLQLYNFGQTVSIVLFEENWRPESWYDKIIQNLNLGFHTLCLLDIKMREQTVKNILLENKIYEKPRFMTINEAVGQIMEIQKQRGSNLIEFGLGAARVGCDSMKLHYGTLLDLLTFDFGDPLHSLVIPGNLHDLEKEFYKQNALC